MKALIIVDYQVDFVSGSLGFPEAEKLELPLCRRIEKALEEGWDIIFTLDTHGENYLDTREGKGLPVPHCIKGSDGWQVYGLVKDYLSRAALVVEKPAFGSMELAAFLREKNYSEVEFAGLVSNICVLSNAVIAKAALPEAEITVDASLTAAPDSKVNENALEIMKGLQITVKGKEGG